MIDESHAKISLRGQCKLLNINRSTVDYQATPAAENDTSVANDIHQIWISHPMYGYRRIAAQLRRQGTRVNAKKVLRLMQAMKI